MKKTIDSKKLRLDTETVRTLHEGEHRLVLGARAVYTIMSLCDVKCPSAGVDGESGMGCGAYTALCGPNA